MRVGVTGHRPERLPQFYGHSYDLLVQYCRVILTTVGATEVYTGMALGFDQAAAQACIDLKIPYIAVLPCEKGQDSDWWLSESLIYQSLLRQAQGVIPVSKGRPTPQKYLKRNQYIIDSSDLVLSLWDGRPEGGTAWTTKRAVAAGKPVLGLWNGYLEYLKIMELLNPHEKKANP